VNFNLEDADSLVNQLSPDTELVPVESFRVLVGGVVIGTIEQLPNYHWGFTRYTTGDDEELPDKVGGFLDMDTAEKELVESWRDYRFRNM
jgi:hypothetical protein